MNTAEAIELYLAGEPVADIARALHVSPGTLYKRLANAGVTERREPFRATKRAIELADIEAIADRYRAGEPTKAIAAELGVSRDTVDRALRDHGVTPDQVREPEPKPRASKRATRKHNGNRLVLPDEDIVKRYLAGESALSIAKSLGVSRVPIDRRLDEAGVARRSRTAAMRERHRQMSPQQRKALVEEAHRVRRTAGDTWHSSARRAQARQKNFRKHVRIGEQELADMLTERGHPPRMQLALGPYNVDLALPPIAVEVHRSSAHPLVNPMYRERARHLVNAGWRIVFVWLSQPGLGQSPDWAMPTPALADKIVAHLELAQRDPSAVREYRVIRGSGEDAPFLSLDPDNGAVIPPPERFLDPNS